MPLSFFVFCVIMDSKDARSAIAMEQSVMQEAVDRIRQMELCFDTLQKAVNADPAVIWEDASLTEVL